MAAILQNLSGNPLLTPVGQKIEKATDSSLPSEDWSLNMEICDIINDTDEGPKDAARAIKKRLQQNCGKNHTVVMYTLTLLETCVKNCGKRFHILVTSKDFIQELVKLLGTKNNSPDAIHKKILSLIQSWSDAFRMQPEYSGVVQVYTELKSKGVEFPVTSFDSTALIHTPQRSVSVSTRKSTTGMGTDSSPLTGNQPANREASASGPVHLNPEQLTKLRSELDVVQGNIKVFHEMLNELIPGKEHNDDWTLLRDLDSTCRSMQVRLVELIQKVTNEEVTNELLRVNDELNYLFERYERYERKKKQFQANKSENSQETSLIDLNAEEENLITTDSISNSLDGLKLGAVGGKSMKDASGSSINNELASGGDAEFDIFAQSRSTTQDKNKSKSNAFTDSLSLDQVEVNLGSMNQAKGAHASSQLSDFNKPGLDSENDLNEMEKWLQDQQAGQQKSTTSENFDHFLAQRVDAIERLPNHKPGENVQKKDPFGL